ncbi:MAG: endonuclease/exonuclease/phosphatase family protein [Verrucomicrobia bacterium]|nr:endonuclease/exonuclease/phosphatase family protein [Verrucomicrobiota bacterium]
MNCCATILLVWLAVSATASAFSLLTYNVAGNRSTDWSTNAPQVRAIGRQMIYLRPDIITFNEIPFTNTYQMAHFVEAFLPGYHLATNSGTDGFLRSVIASRFPITRSQKWLDGVSLIPFGFDGNFTRDLFEAEIPVPGFPDPLHVFTTHLKSMSDATSAARRAAEASAVSNFFVTTFLPANGRRPYVLTGDLNEDVNHPPSSSRHPIQRLVNAATGLHLTTPLNPVSGSERTISIRGTLNARFDYILPCGVLYSNIVASQVFRTDLVVPLPAGLEKSDDAIASDHLPVFMEFRTPDDQPFRLLAVGFKNGRVNLEWETTAARGYDVESSTDLVSWLTLATNLIATGTNFIWSDTRTNAWQFFRLLRQP